MVISCCASSGYGKCSKASCTMQLHTVDTYIVVVSVRNPLSEICMFVVGHHGIDQTFLGWLMGILTSCEMTQYSIFVIFGRTAKVVTVINNNNNKIVILSFERRTKPVHLRIENKRNRTHNLTVLFFRLSFVCVSCELWGDWLNRLLCTKNYRLSQLLLCILESSTMSTTTTTTATWRGDAKRKHNESKMFEFMPEK